MGWEHGREADTVPERTDNIDSSPPPQAYNNMAREDSRIAREDSRVMKFLAFLGAGLLPASFLTARIPPNFPCRPAVHLLTATHVQQALFSSTFFTYGDSGFEVSPKLWIYFAIMVPITAAVIVGCWAWLSWRDGSRTKREDFPQTPRASLRSYLTYLFLFKPWRGPSVVLLQVLFRGGLLDTLES